MSIWSSIGHGNDLQGIPDRCNYTGSTEAAESHTFSHEVDQSTTYSIDVATATSWHDCVRLVLDEWHDGKQVRSAQTMLDPAEVSMLIDHLTTALERINATRAA